MHMVRYQVLICCILVFRLAIVQSAPITITRKTFRNCQRGSWYDVTTECCPPNSTEIDEPILDFNPKRDPSKTLRRRKALQCLVGKELKTYTRKLRRGYALMRALPDSDPRSFKRQNDIHCAYGTGAFIQDGSTDLDIDIHFTWLFFPWHRLFLYFHERILQKLLEDPEFSLHFWNFDNGLSADAPANTSANASVTSDDDHGGCYKPGHFVPPIYNQPATSVFEGSRSPRAFDAARPVDLSLDTTAGDSDSTFANKTLEETVRRNRQVMHRSLIRAGNSTRSFFGTEYRAGVARVLHAGLGSGTVEKWLHVSVHSYIGGKLFPTHTAPSDPLFYPFHANVDRLWQVWHELGCDHRDPSDPDWLGAEFLLWDENAVLRRVQVRNILRIEDLGYTYEQVNDASWISPQNSTSSESSGLSPKFHLIHSSEFPTQKDRTLQCASNT
ncbi:hypothetical protein Mapa_003749 [Marchantia paleacea]|nr:hypothetical protein Mapa_003749 [Marchantia paleacea]